MKGRTTKNYAARKEPNKLTPIQKKEVKAILYKNMELKSFDSGGNPSAGLLGTISKSFSIPQGSANSQRVGNDITAAYMQISYMCTLVDVTNIARVIYFQWHEDDQVSVPVITDILFLAGGNDYTNALYNFDHRDKYKILYDKRHRLEASSVGSQVVVKDLRVAIPHKNIAFNGGGLTTGKNMIYQLLISDSAITPHVVFMNCQRILYRDA